MAIELPDETKAAFVEALRHYLLDELDREIGDLQGSLFLEFVLKEIGPSIYNQAIKDAQASLHGVVADLDLTLHEPEFGTSAAHRRSE